MGVQGRQTLVGEKRGDWLEGKKNGILYGAPGPERVGLGPEESLRGLIRLQGSFPAPTWHIQA